MSDYINRQAVIDTVAKWFYDVFGINESDGTATIFKRLRELPSAQPEITEDDVKEYCRKRCFIVVTADFYNEMYRRWVSAQPQRKTGKWVDNKNIAFPQCSICGMWIDVLQQSGKMNFCPNCGADMRTEGNDDN